MNSESINWVRVGDLLIRSAGLAIVLETVRYKECNIPVMYYWDKNTNMKHAHSGSIQRTHLAAEFPLERDAVR